MKRCRHCGLLKPLDEFYTDRKARDGCRPECTQCNLAIRAAKYRDNPRPAIERAQRWRDENRERYLENQRRYVADGRKAISSRKSHLQRKYGMTLEDFEVKLAGQGGGCAMCGTSTVRVDNIDHDHLTGKVRGILCFRCNAAIGQLDDDPGRARALADYLEAHFEGDVIFRDLGLALELQPS